MLFYNRSPLYFCIAIQTIHIAIAVCTNDDIIDVVQLMKSLLKHRDDNVIFYFLTNFNHSHTLQQLINTWLLHGGQINVICIIS